MSDRDTAMQETEAFGHAILNSLATPVAVIDARGTILEVNDSWRRFGRDNGASPELSDGVGSNYLDVCRAAAGAGARQAQECLTGLLSILDGRVGIFDLEYPCHSPTEWRWFLMRAVPLSVAEGGVVVSHIDISERKRIEEALQESERRFRTMADSAPVLVWMSGLDKGCTFFNQVWLSFTGRTMAQEIGNGWAEGVHPDDFERCLHIYTTSFDARRPFEMEYRLRRHDGAYRWVLDRGVARRTSDGQFAGYIGSCTDITDRKRIEETQRQQQRELAHVQRVSAVGELTGALSHEIKQPLTAIRSNAQAALRFLSREEPNLDELREVLEDIADDDRRATDVLDRLRGLLKRQPASAESVDLNDAVGTIALLLHSDAVVKRIAIDLDLADGLPLVRGDRVQLQQVLLNLVLNGFDAMEEVPEEDRRLVLRTAREDEGGLRVTVCDVGRGLDGQDAEQLFAAFHTTKPKGLGMGLSITRTIVEAHGGKIWAEDNPDRGASFHFTLPLEPSTP